MTEKRTLGQRWADYRASKATLFWSCVACVVATIIVGFTWGGWVTGGTAKVRAENAAGQARADLAATMCVERFLGASDAGAQLAALKEQSLWLRGDFIKKGGWARPPGVKEPVPDAASICAQRLAEAKLPQQAAGGSSPAATTVQ
jgi:hypothetical protein